MKNVSEMTAKELDKALLNVTKMFKSEHFPQDSALDGNGNFKKIFPIRGFRYQLFSKYNTILR